MAAAQSSFSKFVLLLKRQKAIKKKYNPYYNNITFQTSDGTSLSTLIQFPPANNLFHFILTQQLLGVIRFCCM